MLSDPVREWNGGRAFGLAEDIALQVSCIEMFPNLFPISNETHILSAPISLKNDIPSTIMSVSFAIISMRLYPCATAFAACNISSWLHGLSTADIQTHQRLTQDAPIHFHPALIIQHFLHRRRSEQRLQTDNGTVQPCNLRSVDRFKFLGNFPFPSYRIRCLIPVPLLCMFVAFVHIDWRMECDCCRWQAMLLMHSGLPK